MIRLTVIAFCTVIALPTSAQETFCQSDLSPLAGTEVADVRIALVDPGYASATQQNDDGFISYEVFRGPHAAGLEDRLRSDTSALNDLQSECRTRVPQCVLLPLSAEPAVGYSRSVAHSGLHQHEHRLLLGGEQIRARVTSNAHIPGALTIATRLLLQPFLPPCRE